MNLAVRNTTGTFSSTGLRSLVAWEVFATSRFYDPVLWIRRMELLKAPKSRKSISRRLSMRSRCLRYPTPSNRHSTTSDPSDDGVRGLVSSFDSTQSLPPLTFSLRFALRSERPRMEKASFSVKLCCELPFWLSRWHSLLFALCPLPFALGRPLRRSQLSW